MDLDGIGFLFAILVRFDGTVFGGILTLDGGVLKVG